MATRLFQSTPTGGGMAPLTLRLTTPAVPSLPRTDGRGMTPRILPVLPLSQRRLVLRGDRDFLRALRAAEMAEWEASGGDFAQSATETQPAGGGFAGSKVTLA